MRHLGYSDSMVSLVGKAASKVICVVLVKMYPAPEIIGLEKKSAVGIHSHVLEVSLSRRIDIPQVITIYRKGAKQHQTLKPPSAESSSFKHLSNTDHPELGNLTTCSLHHNRLFTNNYHFRLPRMLNCCLPGQSANSHLKRLCDGSRGPVLEWSWMMLCCAAESVPPSKDATLGSAGPPPRRGTVMSRMRT